MLSLPMQIHFAVVHHAWIQNPPSFPNGLFVNCCCQIHCWCWDHHYLSILTAVCYELDFTTLHPWCQSIFPSWDLVPFQWKEVSMLFLNCRSKNMERMKRWACLRMCKSLCNIYHKSMIVKKLSSALMVFHKCVLGFFVFFNSADR